jgi:NAD(P)-dependent dehydrogenase (short-subunit alcohol dehydrogenase family)
MSTMDGEVCIVTGAGSGIGRATALKLAEAGAFPVLVGRTTSKLRDVAAEICAAGGTCDIEQADVTDYDAMRALAASVLEKHGRIDVIVNNAGFTSRNRYLLDTTHQEAEDVVKVNLLGPFFLVQAALPSMLERRSGTIVNVSSRAGVDPVLLGGAMYSASKAAIINLTKYINVELKNTGIRACNIIPGETDTPVLQTRLVPPGPDQLAVMLQPEDVADAILLAVSSPSRVLIDEVIVKPRFQRDVSAEVPDPIPPDLMPPPV